MKLKVWSVAASERIPELLGGTIDLIAASMPMTPDRAKFVDFSTPYFRATQRVLARKGAIATLKDFDGKKIGTVAGSTTELNVRTVIPAAKVVSFIDIRSAIDALHNGEIDGVSG